MAVDVLQPVRKVFTNFNKGLVTRVDDREASEESLANSIGFNLAEKIAIAKKDFGYSKYFSTLPTGLTQIFGISAFRIEALNDEFICLFGTKADNKPHFWVRKYKNEKQQAGLLDSWVELTEAETSLVITTKVNDSQFTTAGLTNTVDDYYNTWIVFNNTLGQFAYIVDYVGASRQYTINETYTPWVAGNTVSFYRMPDTLKLSILGTSIGASQFYSDSVSQDRLSIGWQRDVPTRETALMVEYIKRSFFYDGKKYLIDIDQIYFGREIPDYEDPGELGIEFIPELSALFGAEVRPNADLRIDASGGTTAWLGNPVVSPIAGDINEVTPDVTNYVYTNVGVAPVDVEFGTTTTAFTLPVNGKVRLTTILTTGRVPCTLTLGWFHPTAMTGTISAASVGNSLITGTGTLFLTELQVGDRLYINGQVREILLKLTNTLIVVDSPYTVLIAGFTPKRIVSIGSVPVNAPSTYATVVVEADIASIDSQYGTVFSGAVQAFTLRLTGFNVVGTAQPRIAHAKVEVESFGGSVSKNMRIIAVPVYDGYLLGRPLKIDVALSSTNGGSYYPRVKVDFAKVDKRLTSVYIFDDNGDATKTLDQFVSGYIFSLISSESNKIINPFNLVNRWLFDTTTNKFVAQNFGNGVDSPSTLALGRDTTNSVTLLSILGYGIVNTIPDISTKWRYEVKAALGQQAVTAIDEDDNVLRLSLYDGQGVHNDHVFPNVNSTRDGKPLKIFLTSRGELFNVLGQLGRLYAMKRGSIEIIYASTTQSTVYEADIIAKKSTIFTSIGIVYAGKYSISVLPIDGGLRAELSESIRNEYIGLSDADKGAIQAIECKDADCIIFSMPTIQYFYHTKLQIWWKRKFNDAPVGFTKIADNRMLMASATKVLVYPDRSVYTDDTSEVPFVLETQWMTLGLDDVQKVIRTMIPVIVATSIIKFKINVYLDRRGNPTDSLTADGTPFDVLYGSTVDGILEKALKMKLPHNFKEVKLVFKKDSADVNVAGRLDLLELKMFGETIVTGRED